MAGADHVERAFDLLLAGIDEVDQALQGKAVPPRRFAERFNDRLGARRARARRLRGRIAPPLQADPRQDRLPGDRSGAGKFVVEGQ